MRVRAIDVDHDWLFGKGQNDYLTGVNAVAQNINTRLNSFLGDCFFDNGAGIDWWNLLGAKDQLVLNLAISAVILNTQDVTSLVQLNIVLDVTRRLTVTYTVEIARAVTVSGIFLLTPGGSSGGGDVKSKIFTITFTAEQTKNIDVGLFSLDSRKCSVTVIDSSGLYADEDFVIERPDSDTISIVAGGNISGTFTVLVFEAGT